MDPAVLAFAETLARVGVIGLLSIEIALLIFGILRVGRLVDGETKKVDDAHAKEIAGWEQRTKERDEEWKAREARLIAERDAREAQLAAERDQWRDRSNHTDDRLDRVTRAFERIAKTAAPE